MNFLNLAYQKNGSEKILSLMNFKMKKNLKFTFPK